MIRSKRRKDKGSKLQLHDEAIRTLESTSTAAVVGAAETGCRQSTPQELDAALPGVNHGRGTAEG